MVTAEIISVGTELLLGQIVDTDAAALGTVLAELGITHRHRQTVGDNPARLVDALELALGRSDIVITIGGLGPTQDDLTRNGIAAAIDEELIVDPILEANLRELFAKRNLPWVDSQINQAMRPRCGEPVANPNGTAPGLVCRKGGKTILAMPGPPAEFLPMLNGPVREILQELGGGEVIHSCSVRVTGVGESIIEERLRHLIDSANPTIATYAKPAEVHVRVTTRAPDLASAKGILEPVVLEIERRFGRSAYGRDHTSLEEAILSALRAKKATLAIAESCTGGMLGARITAIPGASDVFLGGAITYSNTIKANVLHVSEDILEGQGAVSGETAREMALGARGVFGSDFALSITGIAGPGGGTDDKPVGLVYVGLAGPDSCEVEERRFRGIRDTIRMRSTQAALELLWRGL